MIKGIGKLVKTGVKLGKPFALQAAKEAVENVIPGGDIGLDIGKAVLGRLFKSDSSDSVAERIKELSDPERKQLADLLTDLLALAEVANMARSDGEIDPEECDIVFDSIDELRQEAEALLSPDSQT